MRKDERKSNESSPINWTWTSPRARTEEAEAFGERIIPFSLSFRFSFPAPFPHMLRYHAPVPNGVNEISLLLAEDQPRWFIGDEPTNCIIWRITLSLARLNRTAPYAATIVARYWSSFATRIASRITNKRPTRRDYRPGHIPVCP